MKYFTWLFLLLVMSLAGAEEYTANLQVGRQLTLGTLVSGVVQEVKVRPGQKVVQGELLLQMDQREFQARLRHAQAQVALANSLFAEALREEQRALELYERGLLSDHELQKAQIEKLEAESRKYAAVADLVQARLNLERSQITAPVDGRILEVRAWKGQPLQNAFEIQPLILLAAANSLRFSLPLSGDKEVSKVQLLVEDQWHEVAGFRQRPAASQESSWLLEGWLTNNKLEVGQRVKVRVE